MNVDVLCFFNSGGVVLTRSPQSVVAGLPTKILITFDLGVMEDMDSVITDAQNCPSRWRAVAEALYGQKVELVRVVDGMKEESE